MGAGQSADRQERATSSERAIQRDTCCAAAWFDRGVRRGGPTEETISTQQEFDPNDAVAWSSLGNAGGGSVKGTTYTRKECAMRAVELDPNNASYWRNLGLEGGGKVGERIYGKTECFLRALEIDPCFALAWRSLGIAGGGKVGEKTYCRKDCYLMALELDPNDAISWSNLGTQGGGSVKGTTYTGKDCYVRSLELNPNHADAWSNLGADGGGAIKGTLYTPKECAMRAVELDPNDAINWYNFGNEGGGPIKGVTYTKQDCYVRSFNPNSAHAWFNAYTAGGITLKGQSYDEKACLQRCVQANPRYAAGWACLAMQGGGMVAGETYPEARCLNMAVAPDADFKSGWEGRRAEWMSRLIVHIASAESMYKIEFLPKKPYKERRHTAVSFPGKFGLAWDLVQGRGTEQARRLLDKFDLGDILGMGELNTCCVFLPEGSEDFGKHRARCTKDPRCWCSMHFNECGLEYVINGLAKNCKPNDVERIHTSSGDVVYRAKFGCKWYDRWIGQVESAVAANAELVAVVPDEGEPGNSQKGEMNFLSQRGYPFKTMKLSDFIFELRSFV